MRRIQLLVQYNGANFQGWQTQPSVRTVEPTLVNALRKLMGTSSPDTYALADRSLLTGSSRTDAGVHALANSCHVDVPHRLTCDAVMGGINSLVHCGDVRVVHAVEREHTSVLPVDGVSPFHPDHPCHSRVADDNNKATVHKRFDHSLSSDAHAYWHARYSATARVYRYNVMFYKRCAWPSVANRCWQVKCRRSMRIDFDEMRLAARAMVGTHDWSAFRGARCGNASPVKTIVDVDVSEPSARAEWHGVLDANVGDDVDTQPRFASIRIEGSSFLYKQVRNMASALAAVACGRATAKELGQLIAARQRMDSFGTAPPHGLCLEHVKY
jgi:tRNA pseudouridine38-40 synthase